MSHKQNTPQTPPPELLRTADMAKLLHCSIAQVGVLRRAGELAPSFKLGNGRYWRRADVLAWLEKCATGGAQ